MESMTAQHIQNIILTAILMSLVGLNFKIIYDWLRARKNGTTVPEGVIQPPKPNGERETDIKQIKKNTFDLRDDTKTLKEKSAGQDATLKEIRDFSRDQIGLQTQTLQAIQNQTAELKRR